MIDQNSESRELPEIIDCYEITEAGTLIIANSDTPDSYIDEFELRYLANPETALYIRETYGRYLGVMREVKANIQPREYRTKKVALAIIPKPRLE